MDLKLFCFLSGLTVLTGHPVFALYNLVELSLAIDETANEVTLSWDLNEVDGSTVQLSRRVQGQTGSGSWNLLATLPHTTTQWTDSNVVAGTVYEYCLYVPEEVDAKATATYVSSGYQVPLQDDRGTVLLVVNQTLGLSLVKELQRFEMDLVGDGWTVQRLDFPPEGSGTPEHLRAAIQSIHASDPLTSVILLGGLPIVRSGSIRPDEHELYRQATDLFYADLNGVWEDVADDGEAFYPGDGHYDHAVVPGPDGGIEVAIGRIDFSGMTAWSESEEDLMRRYLQKNHNFRHLSYEVPREGYFTLLAFDNSPVEASAVSAMLGSENCHEIYDNGEFEQTRPLLWGIAARDWNGDNYPNYRFQSQFTVNFASGKQVWDTGNNPMRAMLAMPWYGLTCSWGVRPNWFFHHMGMGEPIGYSALRTVNNNDNSSNSNGLDYLPVDEVPVEDFPEGLDGYVSLNLMGDPTLRMHPVAPVENLVATVDGGSVSLFWQASADIGVTGYHVYQGDSARGPFARLTTSPLASLNYEVGSSSGNEAWFMVRSVKLEETPVGSYWNAGQGSFAFVDGTGANTAPVAISQTLNATAGVPLTVTAAGADADGDELLVAVATNAAHGEVTGSGPQFTYTAEEGFEGEDEFRFRVWDGVAERTGVITVNVSDDHGSGATVMSYADWQAGIDWQGQDSSPEGNPDRDELTNLWEYHHVSNPLDGLSQHFERLEWTEVEGVPCLVIEWQRRQLMGGLVAEVSQNGMDSWTLATELPAPITREVLGVDSETERVRLCLPQTNSVVGQAFVRLRILP